MRGFIKDAINLSIEKWENVERFNDCLARLVARRRKEITVTGPLVRSKTAWKCAVLQQSLLYRITMLATGCAETWNSGNVVGSILIGRALLETIAISKFAADELEKLVAGKELDAIDELANAQLFATRNEALIADGVAYQARSILTYLDKLDNTVVGVRETYDFLSEFCHPNSSGHLFTYGEINKTNGTVTFSEAAPRIMHVQGHVMTCFMMIMFAEPIMDAFDRVVSDVPEMEE
jgi:hypothetical protein